jgi:hypothetical protein
MGGEYDDLLTKKNDLGILYIIQQYCVLHDINFFGCKKEECSLEITKHHEYQHPVLINTRQRDGKTHFVNKNKLEKNICSYK